MEQKKRKQRWIYAILAVVAVGAALLYWNQQRTLALQKNTYETYTLVQRDPLMLKGTAEVTEAVSVFADPAKGEVREIMVRSGQKVQAGDVLFTYHNTLADDSVEDARRQLDKAGEALETAKADLASAREDQAADESALEQAESNLEKSRDRLRNAQKSLAEAQAKRDADDIEKYDDRVYKENLNVSEYSQEVSRLTAKVDSWPSQISALERSVTSSQTMTEDASLMLERAQGKLEDRETAEFDGIVLVHEENKNNPQGSLVDLLAEQTEIKATVTEYDYFRLSLNQPVTVHVIATDETMGATITDLDPVPQNARASSLTADTTVYYGLAVSPERSIQPGYSIEVEVALDEVIVPTSAIVRDNDQTFLWQVLDGTVSKKAVTLEQQGNYWLLTGGLDKGADIIQNPSVDLTEGMAVKVAVK